jgi:nitroimidazol reductase NimA-like FMN-containing flavoprotein (pyridoxamine 5'-phosphate oxidase superfamily)
MTMTTATPPVTRLTTEQCWDLLNSSRFGRLATRGGRTVQIVPIHYVVEARSVLFRASAGSTLLDLALDDAVALEIDSHGPFTAWSVVLQGTAHILDDVAQIAAAERTELTPWPGEPSATWVRITPTTVIGRHVLFDEVL